MIWRCCRLLRWRPRKWHPFVASRAPRLRAWNQDILAVCTAAAAAAAAATTPPSPPSPSVVAPASEISLGWLAVTTRSARATSTRSARLSRSCRKMAKCTRCGICLYFPLRPTSISMGLFPLCSHTPGWQLDNGLASPRLQSHPLSRRRRRGALCDHSRTHLCVRERKVPLDAILSTPFQFHK